MFKKHILPLLIIFALGFTGTLITLFKFSPCNSFDPNSFCQEYSGLGISLMTLSLLLALTGLLSLTGFLLRWKLYQEELFANHFNIALRQGFLITTTIILSLGMVVTHTFKWWTILIVLSLIIGAEYYFSGTDNR